VGLMIYVWIIEEAFKDKQSRWVMEKVSFFVLSAMGVLGSIDERVVG